MEWIKITEKQPTLTQSVLVTDGHTITMGHLYAYHDEYWELIDLDTRKRRVVNESHWHFEGDIDWIDPTHWMPLPALPRKEEYNETLNSPNISK